MHPEPETIRAATRASSDIRLAKVSRTADVISHAVLVMKIATGETEEAVPADDGKNPAAVQFGRMGGAARAKALSPTKRKAIARKAAKARHGR